MKKVLAIKISDSTVNEFVEIQNYLFNNGYNWHSNKTEIKSYIPNDFLIIIDDIIYSMGYDNLEKLENVSDVQIINSIISYFRIKKIRKIKNGR